MLEPHENFFVRAQAIRLLLTDVDGVLTDAGVYYSDRGEELKRFSIRDGMGVQRLRDIAQIETGILTGENSGAVKKRAEKLQITELHLGVGDKLEVLKEIVTRRRLSLEQIAYIGDDVNDVEAMQAAGLSACPADAMTLARTYADVVCKNAGGHGAFREFAEMLISAKK